MVFIQGYLYNVTKFRLLGIQCDLFVLNNQDDLKTGILWYIC